MTTRLELATSAVTVRLYLVLQQRSKPRGLAEFAEVIQDTAKCGLGCGLKMIASNAYLRFLALAVLKALL